MHEDAETHFWRSQGEHGECQAPRSQIGFQGVGLGKFETQKLTGLLSLTDEEEEESEFLPFFSSAVFVAQQLRIYLWLGEAPPSCMIGDSWVSAATRQTVKWRVAPKSVCCSSCSVRSELAPWPNHMNSGWGMEDARRNAVTHFWLSQGELGECQAPHSQIRFQIH
jgi:hypothetical protein